LPYAIVSAERPALLDSGARSSPLPADIEALVAASSFSFARHWRKEKLSDKGQDLGASILVRTRAVEWIMAPIWAPATLAGMPLVCKPCCRTQASKERCAANVRVGKNGWHWSLGRVQRFRLAGSTLEAWRKAFLTILCPAHLTSSLHLTTCHCV
jgi:hypothetical protein